MTSWTSWRLVLPFLLGISVGQLSPEQISLSAPVCFATLCNGSWIVPDGPLQVIVGGQIDVLNQVSPSTSSAIASGEFWMFWPICSVVGQGTDLRLLRPDLTVTLPATIPAVTARPKLSVPCKFYELCLCSLSSRPSINQLAICGLVLPTRDGLSRECSCKALRSTHVRLLHTHNYLSFSSPKKILLTRICFDLILLIEPTT